MHWNHIFVFVSSLTDRNKKNTITVAGNTSGKKRKIFGEGKYVFGGGGDKRRKKRRKSFGEGKLMVTPTDQPGEYRASCLFES